MATPRGSHRSEIPEVDKESSPDKSSSQFVSARESVEGPNELSLPMEEVKESGSQASSFVDPN